MDLRASRSRLWRERCVLIGGLASCAALLATAALSLDDARAGGEARLARLAGDVAGSVVGEWRRLKQDPAGLESFAGDGAGGDGFTWTAPRETPPAVDLSSLREDGHRACDALLAEASRLELAGDLAKALDLVLDALALDPDAARRAEGRLRGIQLAVKAGRPEAARELWRLTAAELEAGTARGDVDYLLLSALAARPALEEGEQRAAGERLLTAWTSGALALPALEAPATDDPARVAVFVRTPSAAREALLARVLELAGTELDAGALETWRSSERGGALALLLGAPTPAPAAGGELGFVVREGWVLAQRARGPELAEGRVLARTGLEQRLARAAQENGLLPPGFALDFDGAADARGEPVRARTPLEDGFGFVLRHADPAALVRAERSRLVLQRVALIVLALFVAAAALSTFRALRRERRLAGLKSAFVASVSHELRTPLASILLLAENLEQGRVSDEAGRRRYHAVIRREAERLRRLVDDVLDVSRLERGAAPELRAAEVEVPELAQRLQAEARERVEADGGTLAFATNGVPERAWLDHAAVRRAVLNLVDNALRHSGSREVALALGGDGGGGLRIGVRDRGVGIAAVDRERVFEPFERLGTGAPGAGLGLAIVREVARAHGGSAFARAPEEGPGTLVEIHLPRLRREGEEA